MLTFSGSVRVFLAPEPCDRRNRIGDLLDDGQPNSSFKG
jgi:hypothetical protein